MYHSIIYEPGDSKSSKIGYQSIKSGWKNSRTMLEGMSKFSWILEVDVLKIQNSTVQARSKYSI